MEQKESDNIELRSEKVRNVIGKVPPRLVSLGTVVITIIVLALAVAFYKIPYPISIEANGEVVNQRTMQVFVPYKYLYLCRKKLKRQQYEISYRNTRLRKNHRRWLCLSGQDRLGL